MDTTRNARTAIGKTIMTTFVSLLVALAIGGPAQAGALAGAEICTGDSCNGWVIGYSNEDNEYTISNGPTGGDACTNSTNVGFAIAGENNMCQSNTNCDTCNVTVQKHDWM